MAIEIDKESISKFEADSAKVISRCHSRSISADKWLSFVRQTKEKHFQDLSSPQLDASIASVLLLHILTSTPPPSLLLQYLQSAILGPAAEGSRRASSQKETLLSSQGVLIALLAACARSSQEAEDGQASISSTSSPRPASVEAVCVELEAMGFLTPLDSEGSLQDLYRATYQDSSAEASRRSSPALLLVKAASSLFQISCLQQNTLLSRALSVQILSAPAHRALSKEVALFGNRGANESHLDRVRESSSTLELIERCLVRCQVLNLQGEASSIQSIKTLLTDLGAGSSSKSSTSSKAKKSRFHPDLKIPLLNLWASNPDPIDGLFGSEVSSINLIDWQPNYGPEILVLLQVLASEGEPFESKLNSARILLRAQIAEEKDSSAIHARFYLSLLLEATRLLGVADAEQTQDPAKEPFTPGGTQPLRFGSEGAVWIDVLCGFLPQLFLSLESDRTSSGSSSSESSLSCVGKAVKALFALGNETLSASEIKHAATPERNEVNADGDVSMNDLLMDTDSQPHRPIRASLLRSLKEIDLLDENLINQLSQGNDVLSQDLASLTPSFRSEVSSSMQLSDSNSNPLQSHLSQLLSHGDFVELLERVSTDYGAQMDFAIKLGEAFKDWTSSTSEPQLDTLGQACKALGNNTAALDSVFLYVSAREVLGPLASLFDREDLGHLSDEPLTHGGILLFIQICIRRCDLQDDLDLHLGESRFLPRLLRSSSAVHFLSSLSSEDQKLIGRWITALFDSEGISDELIRTSSPQTLLRLAPTLASQCIRACASGIIDLDTLKSGLTYFCNPILSWTLPGVLSRLLQELDSQPAFSVSISSTSIPNNSSQTIFNSPNNQTTRVASTDMVKKKVLLETLCMLLVNEGCPSLALQFASKEVPTVVREATNLSTELSEGGQADLTALKIKSEAFVEMRLDRVSSIQRLLVKRLPSQLLPNLSSPNPSIIEVQSLSSQLSSSHILGLQASQLLEDQKTIASKLVLGSSISLLKEFIQSIQLETASETLSISAALHSSQVIAQLLVLIFELGEKSHHPDQFLALGEILALRLARIQTKDPSSLPILAQALLSIPSPLSIVSPLKTVFSTLVDA